MKVEHAPVHRASPKDGGHYFVGYYDKQPWNADSTKLLAHRVGFCDRFPSAEDAAEVGYIIGWDTDSPSFVRVAQTHGWNWQQGAHLRWIHRPSWMPEIEDALLFNDRDENNAPIARLVDLEGNELKRWPMPVYALAPDQTTAVSLSFGRLTRLRREYGLPGIEDPNPNDPAPENDGIFGLDLGTGETSLICSIAQIDAMTTDDTPNAGGDRHQHLNHMMFNPAGSRFCFMHRFERDDGILQSRLLTADAKGTDIRLLFEGMCSHYDWRDDTTILAWAGKRSLLGGANETPTPKQRAFTLARRTLKPIYYALGKPRFLMNKIMKDSYLMIPDESDATTHKFAQGELTCDGHCTFSADGAWMVTDGYPDLKSRQPLFLWSMKDNTGIEIGRYETPRSLDGELRVDLHPRLSRDAGRVCIDSAMDGGRAIYTVDITGETASTVAGTAAGNIGRAVSETGA